MKKSIFYLLTFLSVIGLSFTNCKRAAEKTAETTAEAIIESATDSDVDIKQDGKKISIKTDEGDVNINFGGDADWPADMPKDVPKWTLGKIKGNTTAKAPEADTWTVYLENVNIGQIEAYEAELKKAGFKTAIFKMDDGGSVSGEKGKLQVACFMAGSDAALTASVRKN
ncbi:MAG TPA: hypothetical protein PLZ12_17790 [Saprospiraceae bacterium]|nr:hypothetical protein [Saprospiraceae bacterium]